MIRISLWPKACVSLAMIFASTLAACQSAPAAVPSAPVQVVRAGILIRVVADLDRAVAFYQGLGLTPTGTAASPRPYVTNDPIARMYDAPGPMRFGGFKAVAPGPTLLLIEFKDMPKKPALPAVQDPGSTIVTLSVRNLDETLAVLKAAGAPLLHDVVVVNAKRTAFLRDPDGAFVELVENKSPADGPDAGNPVGMSLSIAVKSASSSAAFYHDVLGLAVKTAPDPADQARLTAAGLAAAHYRRALVTIPGSAAPMELLEVRGLPRQPLRAKAYEPGATIVRFEVHGVESLGARLKAAGLPIVSAGGQALTVGTSQIFIAPDPNGFYLEPGEPKP